LNKQPSPDPELTTLKKETTMSTSLRLSYALTLAGLGTLAPTSDAAILYVRAGVANGNGASWATAYNSVQTAMNAAVGGDVIYIAAGTYLPSVRRESNDERSKTFALKGAVKYLGGFPAAGGTLAQRDPVANPRSSAAIWRATTAPTSPMPARTRITWSISTETR
jgi:hypothetical protein